MTASGIQVTTQGRHTLIEPYSVIGDHSLPVLFDVDEYG